MSDPSTSAASAANGGSARPSGRRGIGGLVIGFAIIASAIIAGGVGYAAGRSSRSGPSTSQHANVLAAAPADAGFVVDMLDHHQQAVELAEFAQAQTDNDVVRALALAVISDQRWEMGWMEAWLADRGIERPIGDRTVMQWMNMPVPLDQMPGLIPHDEVIAFYNRSGADLDRTFLELMLRHHEGGVHMAEHAAEHATDPALRDLASRIVVKQRNEINDITQLLG